MKLESQAGLIVNILLVVLWLLLFIGLQYIEIPFFEIFFLLTTMTIVLIHNVEKKTFNQKFNNIHFDFRLRKYSQDSKLKKIIINILFVACFIIPFFIKMPFEKKEISEFEIIYFMIFFGLMLYLNSLHQIYDYYYFNKDFIKKPGRSFEKIIWTDLESVEEKENEEIFVIYFKDGNSIKFGSEIYYTRGKNKDEIINYIRQAIKNAAQQGVGFSRTRPQ